MAFGTDTILVMYVSTALTTSIAAALQFWRAGLPERDEGCGATSADKEPSRARLTRIGRSLLTITWPGEPRILMPGWYYPRTPGARAHPQ